MITRKLVGGWTNPSEKYARQFGSFPQIEMKIRNIWNPHPENLPYTHLPDPSTYHAMWLWPPCECQHFYQPGSGEVFWGKGVDVWRKAPPPQKSWLVNLLSPNVPHLEIRV